MRISDWSSDVCSSDLNRLKRRIAQPPMYESRPSDSCQGIGLAVGSGNAAVLSTTSRLTCGMCDSAQPKPIIPPQARKSVDEGTRVSVRLVVGWRRNHKKKKRAERRIHK